MVMRKPSITRTLGPIHFEDLDPHRFEDLVRELIYDYKDWHSIEATGRSGQDGGFDVRAFERSSAEPPTEFDEEEANVQRNDGNVWMIQAKREKALGPARVREILKDVNASAPPYGYILAASADISKRTYDAFKEELRSKGVTEFYLWGKAELEDMLHQPKNDRILFTFFGISLVSKRRSRATDIRQVVSTKNKLLRTFGDEAGSQKSILVRDANDTHYPYTGEYVDFESRPRWKEYVVEELHPTGVVVNLAEHFAWVDVTTKEFDFSEECNLIRTEGELNQHDPEWHELRSRIERQWEFFPQHLQAVFHRNALVRYEDILVVDDKGDRCHAMPHLFVNYDRPKGPFIGTYEFLIIGNAHIGLRDFKRVHKWADAAGYPKSRKIHEELTVPMSETDTQELRRGSNRVHTLYDFDGRYSMLRPYDLVTLAKEPSRDSGRYYFEITHVETLTVQDCINRNNAHAWRMERAVGRNIGADEIVTIYEGRGRYDFEIERLRNSSGTQNDVL